MVDVLSWLNMDHGYFGSSDGPDALSSEPSSPPSGSDEGDECNVLSPKAWAHNARAFGDIPLSLPFEEDDPFLLSLFSDVGKGGGCDVPATSSSVCAPSSWPVSQPPGTVFQEMTELVGHTSPFSLPEDALSHNSQYQPPLPGKRGPPTAVVRQSHSPVQKAAIVNGTPTCWGGGAGKVANEPIFDRNRKNAEAAKQNRLKKKAYLESLEAEAETLREENKLLKSRCSNIEQTAKGLAEEVEYLRSVIRNQSSLSTLLQNIPNVKSVKLSSPLGKRSSKESTSAESTAKRAKQSSGGVCLHVAKDTVSLEFCPHCSIHAVSQQEED